MEAALKRQLVDLEDRYGKKCHVACSLGRRGDNLASELDKCMAKRDVAEHDAKRYKRKYNEAMEDLEDQRRSKNKAVRDAEDEIAKQKSNVEQLKLSLMEKDAENQKLQDQLTLANDANRAKDDLIEQLKEKPAMADGAVQAGPKEKNPSADSSTQTQKCISTTHAHLATVFRKYMSTKLLLSRHYEKNVLNESRLFMQHFAADADHKKVVRKHIMKDALELRKERLALKEQKIKIDSLTE